MNDHGSEAAQIWRHTVYTADMERSVAFWVDGFGYRLRTDIELGYPKIVAAFKLEDGEKLRLVILDPPHPDGLLVGLMSTVNAPLQPLDRNPDGPPRAGETFVLIRVPDVEATFAKLAALGVTLNVPPSLIPSGTIEGSVISPEGNRVVIQQA